MSKDKLGQQPDESVYGSKDQDKTRIRPAKAKAARPAEPSGDLIAGTGSLSSDTDIEPSLGSGILDDESSYTAVDVGRDLRVPADTQPLDTESVQPPPPPARNGRNASLTPTDILKNRFILERVLGAGGMGVVYKAKDLLKVEAQDRDPYVAIKVLGEEFKYHPEAFIALQRESRKTQRIAHPNIVNVYDFDKDGDTVFMTMEYLEGVGLDVLIKKYRSTGGLPRPDVWVILEGICAALAYAHDQNIIHSDLKPGNIFVTQYNTAKVFDFGIARAVASAELGDQDYDDRTVFDAGNLGALTPAYASLEMLEGDPPDVRDDIYAVGCIAYEMFTGKHPYQRKNARDAKKLGLKPARIEGLRKDQWRAIERALAFNRHDRIGSVHEFSNQLKKKDSLPPQIWMMAAVLLITLVSAVAYFNTQAFRYSQPKMSEDEVRMQIERQIRLEMLQKNISEMIASPVFDERWERVLWERVQNLMELLGMDNEQVRTTLKQVYGLYLVQIEAALEKNDIQLAKQYIERGGRYHQGEIELKVLSQIVESVEGDLLEQGSAHAEKPLQPGADPQAQPRPADATAVARQQEFDRVLASVTEQLHCNRLLEMDVFIQDIQKLRTLNMERYGGQEAAIIRGLSDCISKIARNFPERAKVARTAALSIFPNNATLTEIDITTRDNCTLSLAGAGNKGKRGLCQDILSGGGRSPRMVVIPAGGAVAAFAVGKYEVTVAEINHYCRASGSCRSINESNSALPATGLSIEMIGSYLSWLSAETGFKYRLPTLEEWQHAAQASGNSLDSNRNCKLDNRGINVGGTLVNATVGKQNSWGLVNYIGNASEWVTSGGGLVAAGGSFATPMDECSIEYSQPAGPPGSDNGFRVLRELVPTS